MIHEKLVLPPIENPTRILDCGFCTADWATAVAEKYPDAEVGAAISWIAEAEVDKQ
jgi:ubiquinone/menaquinone biosynthesis C-methylase UbiE